MALNMTLNTLWETSLLSDDPWWLYLAYGAGWTISLAVASFALALTLGTIVGTLRTVDNKWIRGICEGWIELFRNIPLTVQIFIWYFVVPELIPPYKDWMIEADPVLSQKIDRLEEVAGKIFRIIEKEPAKKAKASTFLNYYLPTTQKLLDSYAEFEEAGVSGENLNQAKAKIQSTMDSIVAGFEHQLDELYRTDAMDIDSDIRVMETMLRRDTASVADDFGLNGSSAVQQRDE